MAANTNVNNVTSTVKNNSMYNIAMQNVSKAADAFGSMMKQSLRNVSGADNVQNNTPGIQEKMSSRRSQVEYIVKGARHMGDGTAVDESVMASDLKALTSEIKAVVCAVLDVTDEELEKMLAESGMCITDLLNQGNLADFVSDALADGDSMKLLTDDSISQTFAEVGSQIKEVVGSAADELGISDDKLADMLKQFNVSQTENIIADDNMVYEADTPVQNAQSDTAAEILTDNGIQKLAADDGQITAEDTGRRAESRHVSDENVQTINQQTEGTLEEKITLHSENNSNSGMTGNGSESLSGQFLETLISNVDNAINADSTFEGYGVSSEEIVRQIIDAVKVNVNSAATEMELQLHPESLGKVNIAVAVKDGIITAQLATQDEAVKNVIENQLVQLKESFEQQGLKVEAVEVTVQSHGFETGKNLEGSEDGNSNQESGHRQTRKLSIDEINALIGDDDLTDDEALEVEMMRATGRSVDYMA